MLKHAGVHTRTRIHIQYIDSELLATQQTFTQRLESIDAILVPGGFGIRGIEGKIQAAYYARRHAIPYLGICLGMQTAVIEFARHAAHLSEAHSTECDPKTPYPVVALVTEWKDHAGKRETRSETSKLGGTMRLGSQIAYLTPSSRISTLYKKIQISERHRHRYEINPLWVPQLEAAGLNITGRSVDGLVESIELSDHPWFIGCQFHPEFTSTFRKSHPLFIGFINAAQTYKQNKGQNNKQE